MLNYQRVMLNCYTVPSSCVLMYFTVLLPCFGPNVRRNSNWCLFSHFLKSSCGVSEGQCSAIIGLMAELGASIWSNTSHQCALALKKKIHGWFWPVTIWLFNIAMENGPFKDGLPIKTGNFPWRTVSHNQMVRDVAPGPPQHPLHQASPRAG